MNEFFWLRIHVEADSDDQAFEIPIRAALGFHKHSADLSPPNHHVIGPFKGGVKPKAPLKDLRNASAGHLRDPGGVGGLESRPEQNRKKEIFASGGKPTPSPFPPAFRLILCHKHRSRRGAETSIPESSAISGINPLEAMNAEL